MALSAQGQLACAELDFRVADHLAGSFSASKPSDPTSAHAADKRSLLSKSLDFTSLINTVTSPADPHRLVRSRADARKPLTEINASQLKLLGDITSQIRRRTEAIRAASQTIEHRLDLQVKEYQRQLKVLKSARGEMKQVTGGDDMSGRVERIAKQQKSLSDRLDKVVSRAMASHTGPDLGEAERKWLKELESTRSNLEAMTRKVNDVSLVSNSIFYLADKGRYDNRSSRSSRISNNPKRNNHDHQAEMTPRQITKAFGLRSMRNLTR